MLGDEHGTDVLLTWWFLLRAPLVIVDEPLYEYREYPLASVEQATAKTSATLGRTGEASHWHKVRLWRRLRAMTRAPGIDSGTAKVARRELLLLATWPGVVFWVLDDVLDRWPWVDRLLRRMWERAGAPGRIAPTA
jgi:hypothetical protein